MEAEENKLLYELTSQVCPRLQAYSKEEKLLIPYYLALSVQSGGHSVPLDKCTPASISAVYSTEELKVSWTAEIHLILPQSFPS